MNYVVTKLSPLLSYTGSDEQLRSQHLEEKLLGYFGDRICFRRQRSMTQPLLLLSNVSSGAAVEALKTATSNIEESQLMDIHEPSPQTVYLNSLHHVASKIKADLLSTPGHPAYDNLSREAAERCIPDSLYTLVMWIIVPHEPELDHEFPQNMIKLGSTNNIY